MSDSEKPKVVNIAVDGSHNMAAGGDINLTVNQVISRLPSLLGFALPALAELVGQEKVATLVLPTDAYEIADKMNHNDLKTYRSFVEEYNEYGKAIDSIYESVDDNKPLAKKKIFNYLSYLYLQSKESYITLEKNNASELSAIEVVRKYSDRIFGEVARQIEADLKSSAQINASFLEDIGPCSLVIVSHGFINCKVLERIR